MTEKVLREAADRFHQILASFSSSRLLSRNGAKMPTPLYESMSEKVLSNEALEKIAADGFELCVRALHALGASDVTIHECGERDLESW